MAGAGVSWLILGPHRVAIAHPGPPPTTSHQPPQGRTRAPCCLFPADLTSLPLPQPHPRAVWIRTTPHQLSEDVGRVNKFRTLRDSEQLLISKQHFHTVQWANVPRTWDQRASAFRAAFLGLPGLRQGVPQSCHVPMHRVETCRRGTGCWVSLGVSKASISERLP